MDPAEAQDLDEDWELLRKRPVAARPPQESAEDIDADWRTLQNLPPLPTALYLVTGDGFEAVQMWALTCHGERKENREGRLLDCWVVKFERCLWRAPNSPFKTASGKNYSIPKNETFLSVEEAVARVEKIRFGYLRELRRRQTTQHGELKRLQREMAIVEQNMAWGASVDVSLLVLETARSRLLGTFQTQQSRLLGLLQARAEQLAEEQLAEPPETYVTHCTRCQRPLDSPGVVGSWSSLCFGCCSAD